VEEKGKGIVAKEKEKEAVTSTAVKHRNNA